VGRWWRIFTAHVFCAHSLPALVALFVAQLIALFALCNEARVTRLRNRPKRVFALHDGTFL
jgi:hypothetical protein